MAKREIPNNKIDEEAKSIQNGGASTGLEIKIFDFPLYKKDGSREGICDKNPYVVLKYFQKDWECFSDWNKNELVQFSNFLTIFGGLTWRDVYNTGGNRGNKAGLGYTRYKVNDMENGKECLKKVMETISPDIGLFELRVSKKLRVHGFQSQAAFFLVLLDREHKVFPE